MNISNDWKMCNLLEGRTIIMAAKDKDDDLLLLLDDDKVISVQYSCYTGVDLCLQPMIYKHDMQELKRRMEPNHE